MGFYTKCKIELGHASVIPSKCNGYFCDRQMIHDLDKKEMGCGCFQTGNRLIDIVFSCNLKIEIENDDKTTFNFN